MNLHNTISTVDSDNVNRQTSYDQVKDSVRVNAVNYKDGIETAYSNWKSLDAIIRDDEFFFTYEVESAVDLKPFKRGFMKFILFKNRPKEIVGNYYDAAPSNCQGPIKLTKIS
jgi:hypothetical protein